MGRYRRIGTVKTVYGLHYIAGNLYVSGRATGIRRIGHWPLLVSTVGAPGRSFSDRRWYRSQCAVLLSGWLTGDGTFLYVLDAVIRTVKKSI